MTGVFGKCSCSFLTAWPLLEVEHIDRQLENTEETLLTLTADIVAAHVSNKASPSTTYRTLSKTCHLPVRHLWKAAPAEAKPEPKVSIRSSIKPDYIVCLEEENN